METLVKNEMSRLLMNFVNFLELQIILLFFRNRWFCHFDDDNYVNIPALVKTLQRFNFEEDVYLGKPSLIKEMEVNKKENDN